MFSLLVALSLALNSSAVAAACSSAQHRQFDFWIGEWEVTDGHGQRIGASNVDRTADGCVLSETWIGVDGLRGQSHSTWNPMGNMWQYSWSDNGGTILTLSGGIINGEMIMEGERRMPDGSSTLERITWTPNADGTVRLVWLSSRDQGMRRSEVFDGVYRKRRE